ncbi:MAG: HD domain-containing protein [Alphaproteobacteria bacterium]|nr:HD domain-containing protein [Alphaproteobacteria bacterium]
MIERILHVVYSDDVIVKGLAQLKDFDDYTYQHSVDTCVSAIQLGLKYYYNEQNLIFLAKAAILHDIGKMKVPIEIISGDKPLTPEERELINMHPFYSAEWVLSHLKDKRIATAVLMHHEREDGSGYPLGRSGIQIPMDARIISVADIYNALKASRSYRHDIYEDEQILDIFKKMKGIDLYVVDELYKTIG